MNARLITLQGDSGTMYRVDLKGVLNDEDFAAWKSAKYMTGDDIDYLDRQYPELMGVWATAALTAGKILKNIGGKVFKRIAQRVRERKGSQPEKTQVQQAQQVQQKKVLPDARREQVKKTADISKYLPLIGIGAVLLIMVMKK
jgi:hypothetical protein